MADAWLIVSWIGTALFTVSLAPQAIRTWQRKRAFDVSVGFLVMVLAASACMFAYMWYDVDNPIAALGYVANFAVWSMVLYFRLRPQAPGTP